MRISLETNTTHILSPPMITSIPEAPNPIIETQLDVCGYYQAK